MTESRSMKLVAFLQAQNCSNYVGSWRHPGSMTDFLTPQYFQRIARTLEDARFDMAFFDDRLAMPEIYGGSSDLAVEYGIRSVKRLFRFEGVDRGASVLGWGSRSSEDGSSYAAHPGRPRPCRTLPSLALI